MAKLSVLLIVSISGVLFFAPIAWGGSCVDNLLRAKNELLGRKQNIETKLYETMTTINDLKRRLDESQARADALSTRLRQVNAALTEVDEAVAALP